MPKGEITSAQKEKQLAGLRAHHAKVKTGEANSSAGTVRPRKNKSLKTLADRMSDMLPKALDIIEEVLDGKIVDKGKADMAKYVANNAVTLTKAQIEHESAILKYKVDMAKAKEANVVPKEDPQEVAKALAAEGKHISSALEIPDEWEDE